MMPHMTGQCCCCVPPLQLIVAHFGVCHLCQLLTLCHSLRSDPWSGSTCGCSPDCRIVLHAVPAVNVPMIDQSNLLLVWADDSATLVLAFEVPPDPSSCPACPLMGHPRTLSRTDTNHEGHMSRNPCISRNMILTVLPPIAALWPLGTGQASPELCSYVSSQTSVHSMCCLHIDCSLAHECEKQCAQKASP
jgi:hypothetical protein